MEDDYVPPSQRPIAELRNRAAEYRRMAETARIKDTAASLLRLADRFDDLADQRETLGPAPERALRQAKPSGACGSGSPFSAT